MCFPFRSSFPIFPLHNKLMAMWIAIFASGSLYSDPFPSSFPGTFTTPHPLPGWGHGKPLGGILSPSNTPVSNFPSYDISETNCDMALCILNCNFSIVTRDPPISFSKSSAYLISISSKKHRTSMILLTCELVLEAVCDRQSSIGTGIL